MQKTLPETPKKTMQLLATVMIVSREEMLLKSITKQRQQLQQLETKISSITAVIVAVIVVQHQQLTVKVGVMEMGMAIPRQRMVTRLKLQRMTIRLLQKVKMT